MRPLVIDNVRRQEDVIVEPSVPDACYDACNNAALEAQKVGKDPALCDQDSAFSKFLDRCTDCIKEATKSENETGDSIPPDFAQWVNYCASEGDGTVQSKAAEVSTLLVSISSVDDTRSSLVAALSSNGYNLSTTTTDMSTATTPEPRPTITVSQTAASSPGADTNSPNTKVIVPAVVVPVVVCLIAAAAVIWALMRRRRRRQLQQNNGDTDSFDGKAQLHADEFRPELEAVAAVNKKSTDPDKNNVVAELPARELVGSEMDATNQTDDRRASS